MGTRIAIGLALLFLAVLPAAGQTGSLRVRVVEAGTESALPGAVVTLSNTQGLLAQTSELSDAEGVVEFPVLRVGPGYQVEISLAGFAKQRHGELRIRASRTNALVVQLSPELREQVQVRAERGVVELDQTGSSSKFDNDFIDNLPVPGRVYQNILTLAPGVKDSDEDGNPNVHGARKSDFRALVGGVSNTDPLTGEYLSFVNFESIEEIEIVTSGAGVEFGRASGGFARIVQKQGSNEFEGVFNFIFRSSELDGDGATVLGVQTGPEFEWVQPALQISGPIVKDRLWYRLSHEYLDREDPLVLSSGIGIVTQTQSTIADQITWQVSPRNKLSFQFQSDPQTVDNFGLTSRVAVESTQRLERGGDTYSMTWTAPVSSKLFVESLVAYQDHERNAFPTTMDVPQDCAEFLDFDGSGFVVMNRAQCTNTVSGRTSGSFPNSTADRRQRLTVSSQATVYVPRFLGTSHRLKLGLQIENERYFRDLVRGIEGTFFTEVVNPLAPPVGFFVAQVAAPASTSVRATGNSWGVYVEDQLRPVDGLALTLGLRFDREEINSLGQEPLEPQPEADAFIEALDEFTTSVALGRTFTAFPNVPDLIGDLADVLEVNRNRIPIGTTLQQSQFWAHSRRAEDIQLSNDNVAPRFALAWDPWKNGKTKFFVSAGRYYDSIELAVPLVELEPPEVTITFELFGDEGKFFGIRPRSGFSPTLQVRQVDRDLRTPYQDEVAFGFERQVAPETSVRLSYIRRKYRDQLQDIDINHVTGDFGYCSSPLLGVTNLVVSSPGVGDELEDPYTGTTYIDTAEGNGDGYIRPGFTEPLDDCTGDVRRVGTPLNPIEFEVPDGLPDLYVLNPGWGEILKVGNFNTTDYEAYVVEIVRRFLNNWQLNASYTWSEAIGDAEDFNQVLGNERTLAEDERGRLDFDQTHLAQVSAVRLTKKGWRLGGTVRWESGLPFSELQTKQTVFARPPEYLSAASRDQRFRFRYPSRQRNDQRNPSFWTFDVKVAREFPVGHGVTMGLTGEVFNLMNDGTLSVDDRLNGTNSDLRRFGRQFQLGVRVAF